MASKNKLKTKIKPLAKKDHFEALLEDMNDSIKLVAEGQIAFREEVDQRFDAVDQRFDAVDRRFDAVDQRFAKIDQRFNAVDQRFDAADQRFVTFQEETRANFKTVFDYLSRIDNELQDIKKELKRLGGTKADERELKDLTQRVERLECELEECKGSMAARK